jgi:hypothetical protein
MLCPAIDNPARCQIRAIRYYPLFFTLETRVLQKCSVNYTLFTDSKELYDSGVEYSKMSQEIFTTCGEMFGHLQ